MEEYSGHGDGYTLRFKYCYAFLMRLDLNNIKSVGVRNLSDASSFGQYIETISEQVYQHMQSQSDEKARQAREALWSLLADEIQSVDLLNQPSDCGASNASFTRGTFSHVASYSEGYQATFLCILQRSAWLFL